MNVAELYEKANGWSPAIYQITMEELTRFAELVRAAEREACAKVCDDLAAKDKLSNYYAVSANAIRARGEQK